MNHKVKLLRYRPLFNEHDCRKCWLCHSSPSSPSSSFPSMKMKCVWFWWWPFLPSFFLFFCSSDASFSFVRVLFWQTQTLKLSNCQTSLPVPDWYLVKSICSKRLKGRREEGAGKRRRDKKIVGKKKKTKDDDSDWREWRWWMESHKQGLGKKKLRDALMDGPSAAREEGRKERAVAKERTKKKEPLKYQGQKKESRKKWQHRSKAKFDRCFLYVAAAARIMPFSQS